MSTPLVLVSYTEGLGNRQVQHRIPCAYSSLDEGIRAAVDHFHMNVGAEAQHRIYTSTDEDGSTRALVEFFDGEMVLLAQYRVTAGRFCEVAP